MDETLRSGERLNQTMHRGPDSVWDRRGWDGSRERLNLTRVLIGAGGAALAVQGWRQGTWKGRALAGLGSTLAWWAVTGEGDLADARRWFNEVMERWPGVDRVRDESKASFPASDSPSWTPTVGTGLRRRVRG
jgi:hypothetical protein